MGYGLIRPDSVGKEVFVHISAVKKAGLGSLTEGEHLSYDLINRLGKEAAQNLRVLKPSQGGDHLAENAVVANGIPRASAAPESR